ncbi:MAG: hypothetical protein MUF71_13475 [Candidatus Kapabacteria bacterium]|jgi:hypothetical protein|nr:hypothetical protein [Candidatus Kapabacteria bacterium]
MNLEKQNLEKSSVDVPESTQKNAEAQQPEDSIKPNLITEFRALIERSLELELVLSGAVTFSLLQVPSALETLQTTVMAQYGSAGVIMVVMLLLAKPVSYILVGSLLLHLVVRSFWIGMIGVSSVYPDSAKIPESGGPFFRGFMREKQRGLREQATSVDKFCRLIFGVAFSTLAIFLGVFVILSLSLVLAIVVQKIFLPSSNLMVILLAIYFTLFAPYLIIGLLDTAIQYIRPLQHLQHNQTLKTLYWRVFGVYSSLFGSAAISVQNTIAANAKRTYYTVMGIGFIAFLASMLLPNTVTWRTHPYFPEEGAASAIEHNFYENTADDDTFTRVMIQSDIVREPYLRLFLAYNTRYNDSLKKYFPEAVPFYTQGLSTISRDETFPPERLRSCVQALRGAYNISLNGNNLDSLANTASVDAATFRFYTHPKTKQKGILGYIRIDNLPQGEQMLIVRDRFDTTVVRYIPFWR